MIAVRCASAHTREHVFGYHMIAIAIGQGLGPLLLGWLGGGAQIPPTALLFTVAFAGAILSLLVAFGLRSAPRTPAGEAKAEAVTIGELLRRRDLVAVLLTSVVTVTAFELLIVYLPLLGTERGIDTRDVGLLLAVRSLVSIVSRVFYARLLIMVGRHRLLLICMSLGAVAFALMGLPVSLPLMYVAVVAMGFGLGIAATLGFSEVVRLAPQQARATTLSLRLTGNRIGQLAMPAVASVIAEFTGIGGVLLVIAVCLAASGAFTHSSVKRS
jgi:predicted MFS family arabinose efflux permease